jgi:hypothetical protein
VGLLSLAGTLQLFSLTEINLLTKSNEEIADTARALTFLLGHYRIRHGDLPTTESLHLPTINKIADEMAVPLVSGLGALIEVFKAMGSPKGEH